jgi:phosphatidylserine decarboxylase
MQTHDFRFPKTIFIQVRVMPYINGRLYDVNLKSFSNHENIMVKEIE